jgi:DNA-binding GntR family transcriptional regulator
MLSTMAPARATVDAAEPPLAVASVVDLAYAAIRERILSGSLARGARVHQEELALALGVSRTPVREALRRLAAEGLVELHTNRGARVADLDRAGLRAAYEARLVIEPGAARLAAARRPPEALARMREALARQRRAGAGGRAFAAIRDFHLALVSAAGNPFLDQLSAALWAARIGETAYEVQGLTAAQLHADADEHGAILCAVAAGSAREAETLTRRHIAAALKRSAL